MEQYGNILLVEDDESLAQWVGDYLNSQGYNTHYCYRGDEAVDKVKAINPDLVLLDVMLPGLDGVSVCRDLRQFYSKPIIMLTAKDEEMDEIIGLEVGASDYMVKPVRPRVLLARIKASVRGVQENTKEEPGNDHEISVGNLRIDTQARTVLLQSEAVSVSSAEFLLLKFLSENAGEVVSRDAVFKATKGREYDGLDRSVDVLISALRKKFGDDPQNPEKIKTIWGKGYLLVPSAW